MKLNLETKLKLLFPGYVKEYRFCEGRKWRFDYAWPEPLKIAAELEGGVWIAGRHNRGKGFINDMEKYNHAAILGWMVLRFTPDDFKDGTAMEMLAKAMKAREQ